MRRIPFVISIDTEEDNWTPVRSGFTAANSRELPVLDQFFASLGVRATYFTTFQFVSSPGAAEILREIIARGDAELGAHLHPWSTPPFGGPEPENFSMLHRYGPEMQEAKLLRLNEVLAEKCGVRPTTFRAGRFGFGTKMVPILVRNGFRVDSSVTPFLDWTEDDGGPDFRGAPTSAYRLGPSADVRTTEQPGVLWEVPISVGYTRFRPGTWSEVASVLERRVVGGLHIGGLAARTGVVRRAILSPETNSVRDMLAVSRRLIDAGATHLHMFFHSSSLRPGLTPFTRSRAEVAQLYARIEGYLEGLSALAQVEFATVGGMERLLQGRPAERAERRPSGAGSRRPVSSGRERANRLLVINYHYPPDPSVGGLRWAGLSKHLVRIGWEVHVLSATGVDGLRDGVQVHVVRRFHTLNDLYRFFADGVRRWRGPVAVRPSGGAQRRSWLGRALRWLRREAASMMSFPDESRGWTLRAAWSVRRLVRRFDPDVVVSSGPPHTAHLAAALGVTGRRVPLVLDFRDPWSMRLGAFRHDPVYGTSFARLLIPRMERAVFKVGREVIANTRELADITRASNPYVRVSWLRNGLDTEALPPPGNGEPLPGLAVLHAGTLYGGRDSEPVLKAFRSFLDQHPEATRDGSKVRFVGPMEHGREEVLRGKIEANGLTPHVDILGYVDRPTAWNLVRRSGVSLILAQNQELQIPAKLYESLVLNRNPLVIAEPGSATAREGRDLGVEVCAPEDIEGISRVFEKAWRGGRIAKEAAERVDYARLAVHLEELLERNLDRPGSGLTKRLWRSAFDRGSGDPKANWVWLAHPAGWNRALELIRDRPAFAPGMQAHFKEVVTMRTPAKGAGIARPMMLPYPDESFDCVALFDPWSPESGVQGDVETFGYEPNILSECRRTLAPGGCLLIATDNSRWYKFLLSRKRYPGPKALSRVLRDAGFGHVDLFFVAPGADLPASMVPAGGAASRVHERLSEARSARTALRWALAAVGRAELLYPSFYALAYR